MTKLTGRGTPQENLLAFLHAQAELLRSHAYDGTAGWAHRSVYELLLAHGRWLAPAPLPVGIRPMAERECFANAAAAERAHPHLLYTEGLAIPAGSPLPTHHAWLTTPDGRAVDPTWTRLNGAAYFGIPLTDPRLRPAHGQTSGVLERPETLFPLLREGLRGPETEASVGS